MWVCEKRISNILILTGTKEIKSKTNYLSSFQREQVDMIYLYFILIISIGPMLSIHIKLGQHRCKSIEFGFILDDLLKASAKCATRSTLSTPAYHISCETEELITYLLNYSASFLQTVPIQISHCSNQRRQGLIFQYYIK